MEEKVVRLDPWGTQTVKDYKAVMKEFGIQDFKPLLSRIQGPNRYMRRGIIFGHRDFDRYLNSMVAGEKCAMLTGFMPTGQMHFGSKMVADEIVWFQQLGAEPFVLIADIESYAVREISLEQGKRNGIDMLLSLIALGLKPDNAHVYFQSNYKTPYYRLQNMVSRRVTFNELKAMYGDEVTTSKIMSALMQVSDILHPELAEFGAFKNVVVPVGVDQDVHIRLTRDIADRSELGLKRPSSIYHSFMEGLDGGKMSKSRPDSVISLTDTEKEALRKLRSALDGGRDTAEEMKRLGGQPEECMVFSMLQYHLVEDDKELKGWAQECRSGSMLCGDCKMKACKLLAEFLADHQKKREAARKLLPDFGIEEK